MRSIRVRSAFDPQWSTLPPVWAMSVARGGIVPRRQAEYEAAGGERARGRGWLRASPLPAAARSENELACALAGKPIFRAAWRCRAPKRAASGGVEPSEKRPKKRAALEM